MQANASERMSRLGGLPSWARGLLTIALVGLVIALQLQLRPVFAGFPFLLVFPAIAISALLFNTGALAAALGGLAAFYFLVPQQEGLLTVHYAGLGVYAVSAAILIAVISYLRDSADRAELSLAEASRLAADKDAISQEMNHRSKNNLQLIASVMSRQARSSDSPAVREAFELAIARIAAMGRVHSRLVRSHYDTSAVDARDFIEGLCADLDFSLLRPRAVNIVVAAEPVKVSLSQATTVGLLINELVTNALKHAFPDDRAGQITVRFGRQDGICRLEVTDDGVGLAETAQPGLGRHLIDVLVRQLQGRLEICGPPGATFVVTFADEGPAQKR